jgi:hypothetical protein
MFFQKRLNFDGAKISHPHNEQDIAGFEMGFTPG